MRNRTIVSISALLWLLASVTIGLQTWLGDTTIYTAELEGPRARLHFAILANEAPNGGTWAAAGALSIQKRVGVVYIAEGLRRVTGLAVGKIYKLLDSIFLFIALVALFFYLRTWLPDIYCLLGVMYLCANLPLTYFFQLFHPWDRLQLALWILLLYLVATRKPILLAIGLVASVFVKFDTILLPILYGMVYFRGGDRVAVLAETLILLALSFGTYILIGQAFPDPNETSRFSMAAIGLQLSSNVQKLAAMNVKFPPLLVYALPACLALIELRRKGIFALASVVFGLGLTVVYILLTNYEEVRTNIVVLILFMPAALLTVKSLIEKTSLDYRKSTANG